jgi:hypothetical protein
VRVQVTLQDVNHPRRKRMGRDWPLKPTIRELPLGGSNRMPNPVTFTDSSFFVNLMHSIQPATFSNTSRMHFTHGCASTRPLAFTGLRMSCTMALCQCA